MSLHQEFRIVLDLDWQADPAINVVVEGEDLGELIDSAKDYARDLAELTHARGVRSVDLVNGHTVLGFIKFPI
jgi:hypothetical protein